MTERAIFHPFVIPFLVGMAFVLIYCLSGLVQVILELSKEDRKKFFKSLINPRIALKNVCDLFLNCLFHVKLWKRNKLLGYMHSSIAFGWFMLILLGHLEVMFFMPDRLNTFYFPIFFNYFVAEDQETVGGAVFMFLMDFFLLVVLSGIVLAWIKRVRSLLFGMRRTTRPSLPDTIGLYALWSIFPLRLLAEGFTADISGGSFLTVPLNWVCHFLFGDHLYLLPCWWAYSIALCVFMVVIPFSRYMHIPSEMMLIPMRNAGIHVTSARRGYTRVMVYSCPGCGVCIDACPMSVKKANTRDATAYLNRQIRRANERRIEQISDKCMLCGKCSAVCQIGIEATEIRVAQRARRHYAYTPDYSQSINENVLIPQVKPTSKVLYFAGCMTQLTPAISRSMESVLKKAGVDFTYLDKDGGLCCGRPLMTAGRMDQAKQLIEKNTNLIKASGCDTLLLSCPICYKIFNEKYKLEGIRVVHHSVYLKELMDEGRLTANGASDLSSVVFHDPCELGRGSGIYDQPRELLKNFTKVVEAEKNLKESICCGGSLGSLTLKFSQREDITKNSLRNLTVANPEKIATACPLCRSTFARYSDRPVEDIVEIVDKNTV